MIEKSLVEDCSASNRSKVRVGDHPNLLEQALTSEKVFKSRDVAFLAYEKHFMSSVQSSDD